MKKTFTIICLCFLVNQLSIAQQDLTMFNFNDIPQSSYSNPANQFNGKFYIGLPAMSSVYFSASNSGFAYSDFIKKQGDSLRLDFNSMISELEDKNFMSFNTKVDIISFGFKVGKRTQIMFNATENVNFRFNYTKDFATFIHKGNLAFSDNTANFEGLGFSANYYREYGIGISHQFGDKLRVGARFKYLYGIANIDSKKTDISLRTDPITYGLTAKADILINTSGSLDSLSNQDGFISGNDNTGFGIDLGMNYELNNKLSINASVIDLGFIDWGTEVTNHVIDDGQYSFNGIEIETFSPEDDTSGTTVFDRLADSLEEAFNIRETNESYTTALVGRIYIGANYKLNEKLVLGGLFQSEFYKGSIRPSLTASANYKVSKWIGLAASYSIINRSYNNLGIGININPGPVQLYIVSDNILGGIRPQHARHSQVRVGLNLIFGSDKVKEINPSFNPVKEAKEPKKKKKEKKEKLKEVDTLTPVTPVVPKTPETPLKDTIMEPKKVQTPEEKMDSVIERKADSVKQKTEAPTVKTDSVLKINTDSVKRKGETQKVGKTVKEEPKIPQVMPTIEKVKSDTVQKVSDSLKLESPKINNSTDSSALKTKIEDAEDAFEEKVNQLKDTTVTKGQSQLPAQGAPPSTEVKKDSLQQKTDSTILNVRKIIQKAVEPLKVKSDSISAPVQSAPKKAEPVVDPQ